MLPCGRPAVGPDPRVVEDYLPSPAHCWGLGLHHMGVRSKVRVEGGGHGVRIGGAEVRRAVFVCPLLHRWEKVLRFYG